MSWIVFIVWPMIASEIFLVGSQEMPMPTPATVGPGAMPGEIARLNPPFEMPQLTRHDFHPRSLDISQQGAEPGRKGLVTKVIQDCIDQVAAAGGGTVNVPAGQWLSGRIILKTGVNLHLAEGAELHFSSRIEDYLPVVFSRYEGLEIMGLGGLIYAHQQTNIAVTGQGILVGPAAGPVREALPGLSDKMVNQDLPVEERILDGREGRHYFRPYFITLIDCQNVLIEGVTLRNGPMWNIVPIYCDHVIIRGVTVDSRGVVNGDGVNIESSGNVLVEYCSVSTGDDCFALKAGRNLDGLRTGRAVENVVMRHNHALGGFGGITCGSETAGEIRNIHVHDCLFENVLHAVYLKTRRPRGGGGEHFLAERIVFSATKHAIFFDMLGAPMYVGELANRLPERPLTELTPFYRDITLRQFRGRCEGDAIKIKGIPESPASHVTLDQCNIQSNGLINLADVAKVKIRNSQFQAKEPEILLLDADQVSFERVEFKTPKSRLLVQASGTGTKDITFDDCEPRFELIKIETSNGTENDEVRKLR
ncbi:glycoside hydrolase family 28 protein [Bythopirellula polymerisocia]|uniref:Exo-poly-alpha-D-galacturonosidase n=1 Tax=Bythopirellula polymerisocia TaxID=2528003 RepID=A0A5C6CW35_9BACT|nr:glycoside hydrolase family 28 protein [Bythopirellula polymerisocia]TWU27747.1 Exo-poly-alpha-D-galacturonosidase precursor [Bythopirellula polymerisocia]